MLYFYQLSLIFLLEMNNDKNVPFPELKYIVFFFLLKFEL